jgi:hypothetical protein
MRKNRYLLLATISLFTLGSCQKVQQLSGTPHIDYTSFTVFDTVDILGNTSKGGKLKFRFEDGDGDLGLDAPANGQIDSTNLFISLFRIKQGILDSITVLDPLLPSPALRIPYMERLGQNKILKGTISVTFIYQSYQPTDTIKYDFFIKDRALNVSNIATTNEIIPSIDSVY